MIARKLTNVSENEVGVHLATGDIVFLKPGQSIENVDIGPYKNVSNNIVVEYDLDEVIADGDSPLNG